MKVWIFFDQNLKNNISFNYELKKYGVLKQVLAPLRFLTVPISCAVHLSVTTGRRVQRRYSTTSCDRHQIIACVGKRPELETDQCKTVALSMPVMSRL